MRAAVLINATLNEHGLSLDKALRDGGPSFDAHYGMAMFDYVSRNPEFGETFGRYMSLTTAKAEQVIFAQHDFKPFSLAVDVGGNHGTLLLRLLADRPQARGILFDLPAVVAQAPQRLANDPAGSRVEVIGGSFFDGVPAGGDLYTMKQILHDWNDAECIAILTNIRKAIAPGGRLAIIDRLLPETMRPHPAYSMDFYMMLWSTGQERKLSEFTALLDATGFRLDHVTENDNEPCVIEAVPV
jgi:hypothetical protein